jgi:hypothetical protein
MIDRLPSTADLLELRLPGARCSALTIPQLAHQLFDVPVNTVTDQDVNRHRRTAIRMVQTAIATLRLRGVPVCADERGVWRAETALEATEVANALRRRYITQAIVARAMRRAARRMAEVEVDQQQTTLFDEVAA